MGSCKWGTAGQLMDAVREVGKELVAAKPSELAVGNMVRTKDTKEMEHASSSSSAAGFCVGSRSSCEL